MSANELSSALKCFLKLAVCQRSAKTTYKQGLDFGHSYCYGEPTGNMRTFWYIEELTVTIMLNFLQSDVRKKKNENLELHVI